MASSLNLGSLKTPGVYIDEMSLFPPSVAQVDTAVPAFIGYTRIAYSAKQPVKVTSLVEFRSLYGGGPDRNMEVTVDGSNNILSMVPSAPRYLFDSLQLFFQNGGQQCYIVSLGEYTASTVDSDTEAYTTALDNLRKFDEPTLVLMPDAVVLGASKLAVVHQAALSHCQAMQDRFAILDVHTDPKVATPSSSDITSTLNAFRNGVTSGLSYGAAYYPFLQTSLPLSATFGNFTYKQSLNGAAATSSSFAALAAGDTDSLNLGTELSNMKADLANIQTIISVATNLYATSTTAGKQTALYDALHKFRTRPTLTGTPIPTETVLNIPVTGTGVTPVITGLADPATLNLYKNYTTSGATATINVLEAAIAAYSPPAGTPTPAELAANLQTANGLFDRVMAFITGFAEKIVTRMQANESNLRLKSTLYANVVKQAETKGIVVPPSGAVAGAYARTDGERGVWKSPANVGLNYVAGPVVNLTAAEQENLNVDPTTGKSINAIRAFTGKGTLVWGGRTLAGSDNEWRYISVRRFFIMAEESIKKATSQFVFEANDANTWVRVRAMVENFLTLQWRAGALAGAKAEQAFFVRVGLGQTMTPQDVLEGRMIVEIGMAVVRPAEFIVLRFSHKMQEA